MMSAKIEQLAARHSAQMMGETVECGGTATAGLCALAQACLAELALVNQEAAITLAAGMGWMIRTGEATPEMMDAAGTFDLHMQAVFQAERAGS